MPHAEPQPPRRGAGELEAAVLSVLWEAGRALSPGEVQQALTGQAGAPPPGLSYSTVITILSRLARARNQAACRLHAVLRPGPWRSLEGDLRGPGGPHLRAGNPIWRCCPGYYACRADSRRCLPQAAGRAGQAPC